MPILIKVLLLFIWYLLTAAGSYGLLITYLNIAAPINLSGDIIKYGAFGCLAVSLIVAFLLVRPTRVVKKKKDDEPADIQPSDAAASDNETAGEMMLDQADQQPETVAVNENPDLNAAGQIAFSLDQPVQQEPGPETVTAESQVLEASAPAAEDTNSQDVSQPQPAAEQDQPAAPLDNNDEDVLNEQSASLAFDAGNPPAVSQPIDQPAEQLASGADGQSDSEPGEEEGAVEMTNTQQQFIKNSKNSYINTEGLPQFKVTKQIDAQAIIAKENERLDKEELSEKHHSHIDFLTVVLIIILIVVIGCLGYVVYRLFF